MNDKFFPKSKLPIRRTADLLPKIFDTNANQKFISGVIDPWVQPGKLDKTVGYLGRRYGKTFNSNDIYLDSDETLRSRYQLEPGVVVRDSNDINEFYDYIDFKNQLRFFGNETYQDNKITSQESYTWSPPIDWDKFVNFREYYWLPDGPPPVNILGQSQSIISSYTVRLGVGSVFLFTPDGLTNNPTITLYRGQTYKFQINAPENGFILRTGYDTGSLLYDPDFSYIKGQLVVYDNKLWQAKTNIPFTEGSTITFDSEDWQYIDEANAISRLDYNKGVVNNGISNGVLTFNVPYDSPDVLFYQSLTDVNRFGRFIIKNIEENTQIDVEKEILGKINYTSSNSVNFSNGLIVRFLGKVIPAKYSKDNWLVEGVGKNIKLIRFQDLVPPQVTLEYPDVLFDNSGFDVEPFDDAISYPATKDYVVINRASEDLNPWSRYNRWFHRSVLEFSYSFYGKNFDAPSSAKAKRPIIEFFDNLKLYNHGAKAKQSVDFIDTFTDDVFSKIEGSQGYIVDGEELFDGARLLVINDSDKLANNKIYQITFINHSAASNYRQDWESKNSYRTGETVRYNGQSFTALTDISSFQVVIVGTFSNGNKIRIAKNLQLKIDQGIRFFGGIFGGIDSNQEYFIRDIFNVDQSFTEFTISTIKRGIPITLTNGAQGSQSMIANFSEHPTNLNFWTLSNDKRQISLRKINDSEPVIDECVLIQRGKSKRGLMYHFNGIHWITSQKKTSVNLSPLFDVYDDELISFGDSSKYPVSTFNGNEIIRYKIGSSINDSELGFSLSYLNIDNIGDILFEFAWEKSFFTYEVNQIQFSKKISTGFYKFNGKNEYGNTWIQLDKDFQQPIIYSNTLEQESNRISLYPIKWNSVSNQDIFKILIYINGTIYKENYVRTLDVFEFDRTFPKGTTFTCKIFCRADPDLGYYEIPVGMEKNPLNSNLEEFTLGQAMDHVGSGLDLIDNLQGPHPGKNNLRDISNYQPYMRRLLKHTGSTPLALLLLCDKKINIIRSLEAVSKAYRDFKNNFITASSELNFNENIPDFCDEIILYLSRVKTATDAFADSDMIGAGAYSVISYTVEDEGIKTFALSEKFNLIDLSRKAVYIYVNQQQLIYGIDYIFNYNFGFVEIISNLYEQDRIEIREYVSTAFCFIPITPTKLGFYKKFTPRIYLDDTYTEPTNVIQGHDGSITVAFNDFRDQLILELEKRIYNNIKLPKNYEIYDVDKIFGGYYGNSIYGKNELDQFIARQFRRWAVNSRTNFVENTIFDSENSFSYTYSNSNDPTQLQDLPGFWRGVYKWFYDTDRPHLCPWEMLGFSEKPNWWDSEYGLPPYTRNNLILWEDIEKGIVKYGPRAGVWNRYKRPGILNHIPTDSNGKLLDPLLSSLAHNFVLPNAKGDFKFGDINPVEYAWRSSSEYPFAILIALCVSRPFEFIGENLDLESYTINNIGQKISKTTGEFWKITDIKIPTVGGLQTRGLINIVVDYLKMNSMSMSILEDKFAGIDVNLSTRLSGFVDQSQQRYILDSKNPRSRNPSVFIPPENYNIIFNVSTPIDILTYSGLVIEKTDSGYRIFGYDNLDPVFRYYPAYKQFSDPVITVGGISENFTDWEPGKTYNNGTLVRVNDKFFRCIRTHDSSTPIDLKNWRSLPKLPIVGAVTAFQRIKFNRSTVKYLEYGHRFFDRQSLVDFIFGYEEYLKSKGFLFDEYDNDLAINRDWTASVKEFLFWTEHNWAVGSLISLSPSANKIQLVTQVGVIESLLDNFYDYLVYRSDATLLSPDQLNVNREFQKCTIETVDPTDSIYFIKLYVVLKEHVTIFSDNTVFNDILFDKSTGYRQERIKSRGFRTVDWDGDYTSPGFIFDNVRIDDWQPFFDYNLGDIVNYRSFNWTSLEIQKGLDYFDESKWSKLDFTPVKQLVSNFDFKINQFEDYYNVDTDGLGQSQRVLARHLIAYQSRDYLEELAEDEVMQLYLYQGFLKEKGTYNSVDKVFNKLSKNSNSNIEFNEDWAFKIGTYGGQDQTYEIEFTINTKDIVLNPQPLQIVAGTINQVKIDQILRINQNNFEIGIQPFTNNINPVKKYKLDQRSAGFVRYDQVDLVLKERDDLLTYDINLLKENSHIWFTFDRNSWSVVRFNAVNSIIITNLIRNNTTVRLYLNKKSNLKIGDIFGIKDILNLNGFHKIVDVTTNYIDILIPVVSDDPVYEESTTGYNLYFLSEAVFDNYDNLDYKKIAYLREGAKLWIKDGYSSKDRWQVIQKNKRFREINLPDYLVTEPRSIGRAVIYAEILKQSIFSLPASDVVISAIEFKNNLEVKQLITPGVDYVSVLNQSFGDSLSLSPDNKWLAVGVPRASGVRNDYIGEFDSSASYVEGDIVLYAGRLWKALQAQNADGSTIEIDSEKWVLVDNIEANVIGDNTGPTNQGMVVMYVNQNGQWIPTNYILSPRMDTNEYFGIKVSLSQSRSKYFMAVSATGAFNNLGRVYLYVYENNNWKILQNNFYKGVYDPYPPMGWTNSKPYQYPVNSIVYHKGLYYQSLEDQNGDGSSINPANSPWKRVDPYRIITHLPHKSAYNDDGSTLEYGIFEDSSLPYISAVEILKPGDLFGSSVAFNRDGSILVIGAPNADEEYFDNYKGEWSPFQVYKTNDVVRWYDVVSRKYYYRKLSDPRLGQDQVIDSTEIYSSINEIPESDPWESIGDSTYKPTGKVFIYKRNTFDQYELVQTITAGNIAEYNDTEISEIILSGDQFGYSLDIDFNGNNLVITSPQADVNFRSKGSAYIFVNADTVNVEFRLKQILESFEEFANEMFGSAVSISSRAERIAVAAVNARFNAYCHFDNGDTTFDGNKTKIFENRGNSGQIYIFEKKDKIYLLAEKLDADLEDFEGFGYSLDISSDAILAGSPGYKKLVNAGNFLVGTTYIIKDIGNTNWNDIGYNQTRSPYAGLTFKATGVGQGSGQAFENINQGKIRLFVKNTDIDIWTVLAEEPDLVDLDKFYNIALIDNVKKIKIADVDIVDHFKLRILGRAEQEITFKTLYDPAVYNVGTNEVEVDNSVSWAEEHVGKLWWDITTVKFLNSEQGDIEYRSGNFNRQTDFSNIDIYEWVETKYLPSQWVLLTDSSSGLAEGISGIPKYPDNQAYSIKVLYNPLTGSPTDTKYYYWVKNKTTLPQNIKNRRISAAEVKSIIENPEASGTPFISIIDSDKFLLYNFRFVTDSDTVSMNILYSKGYDLLNPVHNEFQLLSEDANNLLNEKLEKKWIDSLVGYDNLGNKVPDERLLERQKYGILFRPRQSMFKNRFQVLETILNNINFVLLSRPYVDLISFENLSKIDQIPDEVLNEYDLVVDNFIDLQNVGTSKIARPILICNIVQGRIDTISIVETGYGYRKVPYIKIEGNGVDAEAEVIIDSTGRIIRVNLVNQGRNYTNAVVKIRNFSVLVTNDETINGTWAIYAWDGRQFIKSKIQSFNTPRYWEYTDWYLQGYSSSSRIIKEITYLFEEEKHVIQLNDIIKVKEFGSGGWALLEKIERGEILGKYKLVGRQNGTIQILKSNFLQTNTIGFDTNYTFDNQIYDLQPTIELRNILKAVKEDIFVDDRSIEWNKLFFTSIRYVLTQFDNVDWFFKTSFINAKHNVGSLVKKPNYKNDNLNSFIKYLEEIKPYRTTIREFTSSYNNIDYSQLATTDFDSPPAYAPSSGVVLPVGPNNDRFAEYPWKWFLDFNGFEILEIRISNPGSGYVSVPSVLINGNGTGAIARAFISNGSVSGIEVINSGQKFTYAPVITLVGGNGFNPNIAKAVAVIGNSKIRSMCLKIKFDRTDKVGTYTNFSLTQTFLSQQFTATYDLKYAPNIDKNLISVYINDELKLANEYKISLYYKEINGSNILKGKLTLNLIPITTSVIRVEYEKNDDYLNAVNRIQKYYAPMSGMKGKELSQLMTGIDFGGVQIQGTTFDVTGGWDALPWFTDNWDSVESSSDFYFIVDGSTVYVDLPYIPAQGELISIYLKREKPSSPLSIDTLNDPTVNPIYQISPSVPKPRVIRIDDPNWVDSWDSTLASNLIVGGNPEALMPSFIGNGIDKRIEFVNPITDLPYVNLEPGDTLIFRSAISDGSVVINDVNIIDTRISGGTLSAIDNVYQSATGMTVEEILIDGSNFTGPDQVPFPEENIPGQVLESLSIKVYHSKDPGASAMSFSVYLADGQTQEFDIRINVMEKKSLLIYVNKEKLDDSTTTYDIDFINGKIVFVSPPVKDTVIEVIAIGIGGAQLLDYQEFTGDGDTDLFLTKAWYSETVKVFVTVNGEEQDAVFYNSTDYTDSRDRTIVKLGFKPSIFEKVKIICLGTALDTDSLGLSLIRVNNQQIVWDGSTRSIELDSFVNLTRASARSSILVEVDGRQLNSVDTVTVIYDGTNNLVDIGLDPKFVSGDLTINDIDVYINNILQVAIIAYGFTPSTNTVIINENYLMPNDEIKVILKNTADYTVIGDNLVLSDKLVDSSLIIGSNIFITWFSEYPSFDLITDQYVGGKIEYKLKRKPLTDDYLFVYVNGNRQTKNKDYSVNRHRGTLEFKNLISLSDTVIIKEFGNSIWTYPSAFEINKDMLNIYHYNRLNENLVKLSKDLNYYDDSIEINDGSLLANPIAENIPGIILVNNEKIEYFQKNGNILTRLRRGTFGTSIPELHPAKSSIVDVGYREAIPYSDRQEKYSFISDGSTLLFGPLDFVPIKSQRIDWIRTTIPNNFGPCDQIEVFVGGRRLFKNSVSRYNENLGVYGTAADEIMEAEFSVDGISPYIRLTNPVDIGIRILIIRKLGRIWYDKGLVTATNGRSLSRNSNTIAKFIFEKTISMP